MKTRLAKMFFLAGLWHATVACGSCESDRESCPTGQYWAGPGAGCVDAADEGEDCSERECAEALYCDDDEVCVAYPRLGEACDLNGCLGALCDLGRASPVCVAAGEVALNGQCYQRSDCADGNACDQGAARCVAPTASGGRCFEYEDRCESGLSCRPASAFEVDLSCLPAAAEGGACQYDDDCAEGLGCDSGQGRCVQWRQSGEVCDSATPCAVALVCLRAERDDLSGVCGAFRVEGEVCTGVWECVDGLRCVAESDELSHCLPTPAEGTACDPDVSESCGDLSTCVRDRATGAGACHQVVPAGMPCLPGDVCADAGACLHDGPDTWACAPSRNEGETCWSDDDCRADLACRGFAADGSVSGVCR